VKTKRACFEKLLSEGMVFVQLDTGAPGVDLPKHLLSQPYVGLNLSLNFRLETFEITDENVCASLSFQGLRHLCVIPWGAVFLIAPAEGPSRYVFPDSAPSPLREQLRAALAAGRHAAAEPETEAPEETPPPPVPPPPRGRPQLRLVK